MRTDPAARDRMERLRDGLLDCASDVLFFEVPGSNGTLFHPRCSMQMTRSFQELDDDTKWRVDDLYVDYFYRRQEDFWQARGYEKLPVMRRASPMLLCGEDLGMVPACVPECSGNSASCPWKSSACRNPPISSSPIPPTRPT